MRSLLPAVVVAAVVAAGTALAVTVFDSPRLLVVDVGLVDIFNGSDCAGGRGGFGDVAPGMPVTVRNSDAEVIASGFLEEGDSEVMPLNGGTGGCVWSLAFKVSTGEGHYVVEAGRRGELSFSEDDLESRDWHVGVTIGG